MDKFTVLESVAAPLRIINIDTDMIIPKQHLTTTKRTGLGTGLFSEMRYREDGSENPDFVLNQPAYRNAKILVAGDNFGCGSSREHAPWAPLDFGIRCVRPPRPPIPPPPSPPTATPRSWWRATISAAAPPASTPPGRCSISASAA